MAERSAAVCFSRRAATARMDSAALTSDEADFTPLEDAPTLARSDPGRLPTCGGVSSAIALLPRDEPGPGVGRDPERAGKCSDWPTSS
jgi:hypothetical protein